MADLDSMSIDELAIYYILSCISLFLIPYQW